jgi:hypothetical protein
MPYSFTLFMFWLLAELAMLSLGSSWSHICLLLYKMYCFQFCHTRKLMRNSGTLTLMNTYESNLVRIYPVCCCIATFHQSHLCVYVYAYVFPLQHTQNGSWPGLQFFGEDVSTSTTRLFVADGGTLLSLLDTWLPPPPPMSVRWGQ